MRGLLPVLAAATLLLAGCSNRERANPFDPLNPNTSGRPAGFVAVAGDRQVRLSWQAVQGNNLIGYQIFRRDRFSSTYGAITGVLGLGTTSFLDFPLPNGTEFAYRLYFVFTSGPGNRPAEDVATPDQAVPWLIEGGGSDLVQITPDDRRVATRRGGYGSTTDLGVNPSDGTVWVTDEGFGRVVVYAPSTGVTVSIPGFNRPRAVAVDPFDGSAWICDVGQDLVYHYKANGDPASLPIAPLNDPVDAAVDGLDGSVWVIELAGDRVGRYDIGGPIWQRAVPDPSRVAVDSTTRDGWITSYTNGTVTHLSVSGQPIATLTGFVSPLGIAVDARRGRIWIADPGASRVVALRRDGSEEFRLSGLADAGELGVDLDTGDAWVVLGDPGQLARIGSDGVLERVLTGLRSPIAVSVDPGGR